MKSTLPSRASGTLANIARFMFFIGPDQLAIRLRDVWPDVVRIRLHNAG